MRGKHEPKLSARLQEAVEELKLLVGSRFPEAEFRVYRSPDDRHSIDLIATVDFEDQDEVMDVVIERVLELLEAGVAVHVVPVRPVLRNQTIRTAMRRTASGD